jgi:hypothetical protein
MIRDKVQSLLTNYMSFLAEYDVKRPPSCNLACKGDHCIIMDYDLPDQFTSIARNTKQALPVSHDTHTKFGVTYQNE